MAHGLLSGRMTEATTFAADDWRSKSDLIKGDEFRRNLASPGVDVAIVGARSPELIRQTAPAADLTLSPEDMAQIDLILRGEVAVAGPAPEKM
jgi:aryl-alcohol dehydrogenase-like predicted oxidoreductase